MKILDPICFYECSLYDYVAEALLILLMLTVNLILIGGIIFCSYLLISYLINLIKSLLKMKERCEEK